MLEGLKKALRMSLTEQAGGGVVAKHSAGAVERASALHAVRVFFTGGTYAVIWRAADEVGDLLGIASAALGAVRYRTAGEIVEVTVDVDPSETLRALAAQGVVVDRRGYSLDGVSGEDPAEGELGETGGQEDGEQGVIHGTAAVDAANLSFVQRQAA